MTGFTVPFEITVPDGWAVGDGWILIKEDEAPDELAIFPTFLSPGYVPTDACAWRGAARRGRSVA